MIKRSVIAWLLFLGICPIVQAAVPAKFSQQPDAWFLTEEGRKICDHVLSWQSENGSWPKNKDTGSKAYDGPANKLKGTFDNGATTSELNFLGRAVRITQEPRYLLAFNKGFDLLIKAQYATGGWPQRMPLDRDYSRHITFNDGTMVKILELLRNCAQADEFGFIDATRRAEAKKSFDAGIDCIVRCQIVVDGQPTVWCAQHDEQDLQPRPARAYELVSLSGSESAGIVKLLMSLDNPSPAVQQAIRGAVDWFGRSKIPGIRIEKKSGDSVVVEDTQSPGIWARFYEIDTNRPFFCGRDGIKKYQLSEIEIERRNGYSWYGAWGEDVAKQFSRWQERWK